MRGFTLFTFGVFISSGCAHFEVATGPAEERVQTARDLSVKGPPDKTGIMDFPQLFAPSLIGAAGAPNPEMIPQIVLLEEKQKAFEEEIIEQQAETFIAARRWKSALNILLQYEPRMTFNLKLSNQLVLAANQLGYYDLAISQLVTSLDQVNGTDILAIKKALGQTYMRAEKFTKAEKMWIELAAHGDPDAKPNLFLAYFEQNEFRAAQLILNEMDRDDPRVAFFELRMARAERESGQVANAIKRLAAAYVKFPDDEMITVEYSIALFSAKKFDRALSVLDAHPQQFKSRLFGYLRAQAQLELGQTQKARRSLAAFEDVPHKTALPPVARGFLWEEVDQRFKLKERERNERDRLVRGINHDIFVENNLHRRPTGLDTDDEP